MLVIYLEGNWAKELDNISQLASQFELNSELLFFFFFNHENYKETEESLERIVFRS